jgi:hypothetical protein
MEMNLTQQASPSAPPIPPEYQPCEPRKRAYVASPLDLAALLDWDDEYE